MPALAKIHSLPSIQGEQEEKVKATVFAPQAEVDKYVDSVSDEVLACRERGHRFPPLKETWTKTGLVFTGYSVEDGLFVRRVPCERCALVDSVEYWEAYKVGRSFRYRFVDSTPDYSRRGPNGERYLGPSGQGRMSRRQIREAQASGLVGDVSRAELVRRLRALQD